MKERRGNLRADYKFDLPDTTSGEVNRGQMVIFSLAVQGMVSFLNLF
jgi:hypothetical protein